MKSRGHSDPFPTAWRSVKKLARNDKNQVFMKILWFCYCHRFLYFVLCGLFGGGIPLEGKVPGWHASRADYTHPPPKSSQPFTLSLLAGRGHRGALRAPEAEGQHPDPGLRHRGWLQDPDPGAHPGGGQPAVHPAKLHLANRSRP